MAEIPEPLFFEEIEAEMADQETKVLTTFNRLNQKLDEEIGNNSGKTKKTLEEALSHLRETMQNFDDRKKSDCETLLEMDEIELGIKRVLKMPQNEVGKEKPAPSTPVRQESQVVIVNITGGSEKPKSETTSATYPLTRPIQPWNWDSFVKEMAQPKRQQQIAGILLLAIGFMLRTLITGADISGTSSQVLFGNLFLSVFLGLGITAGLVVGLIVSHRRQQYTLKKIMLIPPMLGAIAGFILIDNFVARLIFATVVIMIIGFYLARPVEIVLSKIKGTLRGKTSLAGLAFIATLLVAVAGITSSVLLLDRKLALISISTILVFTSGNLLALSKKKWSVFLIGSILSATSFGGLYGSFYLIDWSNFWSNTPAVITTASVLGLLTIGFIVWFMLRSSKETSAEEVKPSSVKERSWSLARIVILVLVGFTASHFLQTYWSEPKVLRVEFGEGRVVSLKAGETFSSDVPKGTSLRYEVISQTGRVQELLDGEKTMERGKEDGLRVWDSGVSRIDLTNTSDSPIELKWSLPKKKE